MVPLQFHEFDGRRLACRHSAGSGPALVFLPGYRGDMTGAKASAVLAWAQQQGRECLLLDYSGCGASGGDFAAGTLSRWRDEALALIAAYVNGPAVLIGSSMGGWLMLLVAEALQHAAPGRVHALVGIAAAPDFTDWGRDDGDKARLAAGETVYDVSPDGSHRSPIHPGFWADGQINRRLVGPIEFEFPVRLLHGMADATVPWGISVQLMQALRSPDVHLTLVKDGDHSLSREADIALLLGILDTI